MRHIRGNAGEATATIARLDTAPSTRVLAAVAVTVTAWASAFVTVRAVRDSFDPGALALGRLLIGSVALGGLMLARRAWVRPDRLEWALIGICGVAWFAIYNVALNAAEQRIDAGTAAMLINVGPILIALLAGLILGEGFPRWLLIGAGVAFAGALVIGAATAHTTGSEIAGVALCLVAALAWAIGVLAQKPALRRIPALQVTQMACTVGALACLPFAGRLTDEAPHATAGDIAGLIYLGLVPTAVAFCTWAYALSRMSAGSLGVTTYLVPPITIAVAWPTLGETPPLLAVVGGALALIGVSLARRRD
jgi:drug/metabolite transporter (DMT)-like permease